MRAPLIGVHGAVIWFLLSRGRWWLWLVPCLGIVLFIIWYAYRQQDVSADMRIWAQEVLERYGIPLAWSVLLVGLRQLLTIFGLLTYATWFFLLGGHMVLYLGAIGFGKKDLALIAHTGRWVSGWLLVWQSMQFGSFWLTLDIISLMISVSFALYACVVFVIGTLGSRIDRRIPALLVVFSQLTVLVWVVYAADTFSLWTVLGGQIYLGVMYGLLHRIYQEKNRPLLEIDPEEDLLHVILRGEQIHAHRELPAGPHKWLRELFLDAGNEVISKLPDRALRVLGGLNLLCMVGQLVLVVTETSGEVGVWIDVWFRASVAVYIMNYIILQQQRIDVWGQRAMTFFLITFGIYLTIYHLFGNVPLYLVGCGVVRSLANALMMIHLRGSSLSTMLTEKDYQYWLLGNMIACIANSYFMVLLPISGQLRFTLVMIYLALQALLLHYQLKKMR